MKKVFSVIMCLMLVVTGVFALSACKENTSDAIVGKWTAVKITMKQGEEEHSVTKEEAAGLDANNTTDMETMIKVGMAEYLNITAEFTKDGKVTITGAGENASTEATGTYTVDGDKINIDVDENSLDTTATLNDGTLTVSYTEENMKITLEFKKSN